jgi:hypothetical protein
VCHRFERLLYTPALRAALHRAHMLPQGASLAPGESLTSPDGRFRFVYQTDAKVVLYYAPSGHVRGVDGTFVWTLPFVGAHYGYTPGRLALLGGVAGGRRLVAFDNKRGAEQWTLHLDFGSARFAPPYRLVVRDVGDVAILDADDAEVWATQCRSDAPGWSDGG